MQAERGKDTRGVFAKLKSVSPAFMPHGPNSKKTVGEVKDIAHTVMQDLANIWGTSSIREILDFCEKSSLCSVSPLLQSHLNREPRAEEYDAEVHSTEKGDWLADSFLAMAVKEVGAFTAFAAENTPYSTQHGSKGEEHDDVLVVFDDTESAWSTCNFGKTLLRPWENQGKANESAAGNWLMSASPEQRRTLGSFCLHLILKPRKMS